VNILSQLVSSIGGSFLPSSAQIQNAEDQAILAAEVLIGLELLIAIELFVLVILVSRKA